MSHFEITSVFAQTSFQYDTSKVDPLKYAPPSIKTYEYFTAAARKYGVPERIALGVIQAETGFHNPMDSDYDPCLTSSCGAEGPGQVMPATGRMVSGDKLLTKERLRYDIRLNADISMRYLRSLYTKFGNWPEALGCYNTGYRIVNGYAQKIMSHSKV